ncbi:MDR family MFS transporter [Bacillus marinisedimentorum]|uniref:MDR family MFS transporter n=1 Tax=Bacillus marinisedimentorum TaxID=1821260 RepID=UPI0007DF0996|nr:MFS transporter [Bacillus marinisedimentorum]
MKWKDWDRNLKIRLVGEGLMNVLFWTFFPFMAIYFADTLGKMTAGMLLIGSQVVAVFANLFGGYAADRFGRKKMMAASAFGQGIAFVMFAYANSPWYQSALVTFLAFTALGVFGSLYWPASHAMVADVVPEEHRSSVFAVFYTAINIAVVFGPVLGGYFFFEHRFGLLVAAALISFGMFAVLQRFLRETIPDAGNRPMMKNNQNVNWHQALLSQLEDYRVILYDRTFLMFIAAGILVAQTFMQMDLLMAVYTNEVIGKQTLFALGGWELTITGEKAFSLIIAENGLLVALFTVIVTRWIAKYPEHRVFVASSLTYAAAILLFGSTGNVWVLFAAMAVFTAAELMVVGIQESFIAKLAPEAMRGQYFAAASLRFTIGRTIAPISIPLTLWVGYGWTFAILSLLAVLAAVLYYSMFKRMKAVGNGSTPEPAETA